MNDNEDAWFKYVKDIKKLKDNKHVYKEFLQEKITNDYLKPSNIEYAVNKIDLHGLTQEQAFEELKDFLEYCYDIGKQNILIITGKGKLDNPGVIKLAVPRWLAYTELKKYILSHSEAKYKFGGSGAIAVLLKKKPNQEYHYDK